LIQAALAINNAKCYSDLNSPASMVSKALSAATGAFVQAAVLHKLFSSAEANVGSKGMQQLEGEVNANNSGKLSVAPKIETLDELVGKQLSGPEVTNIAARNDGVLGEQISKQILEEETGQAFQGIQNGSGNGPDLIGINTKARVIEHVEVKSSVNGNPAWPSGNPTTRFMKWIDEAVTGTISGKRISAADQAYAIKIKGLLDQGYTLSNKVMQVSIPKTGASGVPTAKLSDWP
jgi:hypothetical protein